MELMKEPLLGKTPDELRRVTDLLKLPAFAARQLCEWLYRQGADDFEKMTNLPKAARQLLNEQYSTGRQPYAAVQTSSDGTKKYLFPADDHRIEAVYIPDRARATLCVSSQAGCKMACRFCMTGQLGFQGQLTASGILNQFFSLPERAALTNIVFMGMGEPLDNLEPVLRSLEVLTSVWGCAFSPRRITVSTIGMIPALDQILNRSECHLAVSLHSPFHEERRDLMPLEDIYPIARIVEFLRDFDWYGQRRLSFEYILLKGENDSQRHALAVAELLDGLSCRINLIRFHSLPDCSWESPEEQTVQAFREALVDQGLRATVRTSRGQDIAAACGQLAGR